MPLLTIIIPVYNVEKYLARCLDSVLFPEISDYNVIAVNDGSTDSSALILNDYAKRFPDLLTVITQENKGLGEARNSGIRASSGKYLVFLDSDDSYAPGAVSEILEKCRGDFDICIFDYLSINETGNTVGHMKGCSSQSPVFSLETQPELLFELPSATNKIIRRSLFTENNISFPERVWFEDFRTVPKLYPFADKITYVPKEWYVYLQQSTSITHVNNPKRNLEIIDAAEEIISFYQEKSLFEKYHAEMEYAIYYNVLLTSVDRVNLISRKSEVQDQLVKYYTDKFPEYENNRYFKSQNAKYKLIHFLIIHRMYFSLNILLRFNNLIKGK